MMSTPHRLILASTSPRRVKLLRDAGYAFSQVAPPVDDATVTLQTGITPVQATVRLADLKADSVLKELQNPTPHVILACDTLLSLDGRLIGKPTDELAARQSLISLFAKPHRVTTGVVILKGDGSDRLAFSDTADVSIRPLSPAALQAYIQSGRWRGKAGGYNLAELTDEWDFKVEGDPTTVVGLPMKMLKEKLSRFDPNCLPSE